MDQHLLLRIQQLQQQQQQQQQPQQHQQMFGAVGPHQGQLSLYAGAAAGGAQQQQQQQQPPPPPPPSAHPPSALAQMQGQRDQQLQQQRQHQQDLQVQQQQFMLQQFQQRQLQQQQQQQQLQQQQQQQQQHQLPGQPQQLPPQVGMPLNMFQHMYFMQQQQQAQQMQAQRSMYATQAELELFWQDTFAKLSPQSFRTHALPLARIKRIMKSDEQVKMISAEAPLLFAKAAEAFIRDLTIRAWHQTEANKRRTVQRSDIGAAAGKCDMFDFLIDIVPREEMRQARKEARAVASVPDPRFAIVQQALQLQVQPRALPPAPLPPALAAAIAGPHGGATGAPPRPALPGSLPG